MNTQLLVIVLASAVVTVPLMLFLPHQRQSPWFDRVLGVSTWLLGILGAFGATNSLGSDSAFRQPQVFQLPLVPTLGGIIGGALSIHVFLWLMDRFGRSEDELAEDENEEP